MDVTNSVVFACTMIRNPKLALRMIRQLHPDRDPRSIKILVGRDDDVPIELTEDSTTEEIEKALAEAEKTLIVSAASRGARLDLYFEDDVVVIAIEMQRETESFVVSRSIFISAILTAYLLNRGASFEDMKQIRVTFLYLHDPFGFDDCYNPMEFRLLKHLEYEVKESPRIEIYYVSGDRSDVGENLQELMEYFQNPNSFDTSKARNDLIPELHTAAVEVMKDGRVQRMVAMARLHDMGVYKQGVAEGRAEGIEIGEHRGIEIGEHRGIEIGEHRGIEIGEQRGIKIGEQKMRELAQKMRDRGEPEDKVLDDTGYTFYELDAQ